MNKHEREQWDNWERGQCDNGTLTRDVDETLTRRARQQRVHVRAVRAQQRIDAKQRELLRREIDARVYKYCRVNNVSFDECINENNRAVYAHTVATLERKR